MDIVFDVFFGIDIVVNFFSAYYDHKSKLVDDRKKIVANYAMGWLIIDLVAILPLNYFLSNETDTSSQFNYNKLLRLMRIPRLYRLLRLLKLSKSGQDTKNKVMMARVLNYLHLSEGLLKILSLVMNILFFNHMIACFYYFIPKYFYNSTNSWLVDYKYADKTLFEKYCAAFYWSFQTMTTVGYGDVGPLHTLERMYSILWIFLGVGFFSYMVGNLTSIMSSISKRDGEYFKKLNQFADFADKIKLPQELKNNLYIYFQSNYNKNVYQVTGVRLPPALRAPRPARTPPFAHPALCASRPAHTPPFCPGGLSFIWPNARCGWRGPDSSRN